MKVSNEEGLTYAQAGAVTFFPQNTNFEVSSTGDLVTVDGAAGAVVVLPYPDVQRTGRAADVGGRTLFALKAVDAVGDETQATERHGAVGEQACSLRLALEGVPEFVGSVVGADRQVILLKNVRDFGVKMVG